MNCARSSVLPRSDRVAWPFYAVGLPAPRSPRQTGAGYVPGSVKTGYEASFTRYFYQPQPLRTGEGIRADVLALEKEGEGLLTEIIGG